jgi:hypothetical protein
MAGGSYLLAQEIISQMRPPSTRSQPVSPYTHNPCMEKPVFATGLCYPPIVYGSRPATAVPTCIALS